MKSMTGFGRATDTDPRGAITVTIRTVNHKNLEQSYRLPERLWEIESLLRARVAETLNRGKVDVSIRSTRQSEATTLHVDSSLAGELVAQLETLAASSGIDQRPTLEMLLSVPGVVSVSGAVEELASEERETIFTLLAEALAKVEEMRSREGRALRDDIAARLRTIAAMTSSIEESRERVLDEQTQMMRKRLRELAESLDTEVAEDRLAAEIAIAADKIDIAEETARLSSHIDQMRELLSSESPAGRKMDFLCQEMTREVNTIGSKSRAPELKAKVIEFKAEIERIREQVQNVE